MPRVVMYAVFLAFNAIIMMAFDFGEEKDEEELFVSFRLLLHLLILFDCQFNNNSLCSIG